MYWTGNKQIIYLSQYILQQCIFYYTNYSHYTTLKMHICVSKHIWNHHRFAQYHNGQTLCWTMQTGTLGNHLTIWKTLVCLCQGTQFRLINKAVSQRHPVVLGPLLQDPDDVLHLWVPCVSQQGQDFPQCFSAEIKSNCKDKANVSLSRPS